MSRAALTIGWLVVLPGLVAWGLTPGHFAMLWIDTSRATADRIRPGMTLAEAEWVIGGPPGDYRHGWAAPHFDFVSGSRWPNAVTWITPRGRIDVIDGETGLRYAPDGREINPGMRTPDGIVDDVRWYENSGEIVSRDVPWERAALVYPLFAVIYVCCWVIPRRADAAAARCVSAGGGG